MYVCIMEDIQKIEKEQNVMDILSLHRAATVPGRIGHEARKARWEALHNAVASLVVRLPFKWHAVEVDNPTQNHTGVTNGRDHIVLDEPYDAGRLHRKVGAALCGGDTVNLWNPAFENHVTCRRCLELAQRIAERK